MVKHTHAIRRLLANEMYECVWPFGRVVAQKVKLTLKINPYRVIWRSFLIILHKSTSWAKIFTKLNDINRT